MRNQRVIVAAIAFALAASCIGYYLHGRNQDGASIAPRTTPTEVAASGAQSSNKSQSVTTAPARVSNQSPTHTTAEPLDDAPLAKHFDRLKAAADHGDAAAASQLATELRRCTSFHASQHTLPTYAQEELARDTSNDSPEELKTREVQLAATQAALVALERNRQLCDGVDSTLLAQGVPATLKAAQLGDPIATRCYLSIGGPFDAPGLLDHPEWLTDFKQNAMALAQRNFENGDWPMVSLMAFGYQGRMTNFAFTQLAGADPTKAYGYLKLERLGAGAKFAASIDPEVAAAANLLTPEQIAEGDAWAQDAYSRYFANSSSDELWKGVDLCPSNVE